MKGKSWNQKLQSILLNEYSDPSGNEGEDYDEGPEGYEADIPMDESAPKDLKEYFGDVEDLSPGDMALDHDYIGSPDLGDDFGELPDEYMDDPVDNGFNPEDTYDEYSDEFEDDLDNYDDIDAIDNDEEEFYDELSPDFMPESKKSKVGRKQESMLPDNILRDYEMRANAERKAGTVIEINHSLPYVAINFRDGEDYFFQGEEASNLLDEVPENINEEDYLLAISQGW